MPLPQAIIKRSPAKARVASTIPIIFFLRRGIDKIPAPASANPGRGNHSAAPGALTEAAFAVVIVRVAVPVPPLVARFTGVVTEQVGALVVGVTLQLRGTFPTNPVEVTVTVAVPVLPRLIVLGETAPMEIVNCDGNVVGEYFTTKASPVLALAV